MSNRKIAMYEYQAIIYRFQNGQSIRSLAAQGFAGRNKLSQIYTVASEQGWLISGATIPDESTLAKIFKQVRKDKKQAKANLYHDEICRWVQEGIQGSTIYAHLVEQIGYSGSYQALQRYIRQMIDKEVVNQLTVPLSFLPGEAAQIDFGKGPDLYDDRIGKVVSTWFFVMTLCWSRHHYAELVTHQDVETWLACHQRAFEWFAGVPSKLIIDNPKCAITKACYHNPVVQRSYEAFAQSYRFIISACPPYDPKKKGRVVSGVKYLKRDFVPLRQLRGLVDANRQLRLWVMETAGNRTHGSTFEQPMKRFNETEKSKLKPLPDVRPEIAHWQKVNLYKDCHVRYQKCKYSAPYQFYGQPLWLKVTPSLVAIYHESERIALHARLYKAGSINTKLEHLPPKASFYLNRNPAWCLKEAVSIGKHCQFVVETLLTDPVRDLLRQTQSLLALQSKYGRQRLDHACQQASSLSTITYQSIKTILQEMA